MTHRSLVLALILISLSLLASSCNHSEEVDPAIFENAREIDLTTVKEARLVPDGSFNIGSYQTVNDIGTVAADAMGNVYAVNDYNKRVEVYGPSGENIESLGGLGSDPGDYRDPAYLKVMDDDLYAFDNSLNRAYSYKLPEMELRTVTELENTMQQLKVDSLASAKPVKLEVMPDGQYLVGFQVVKSTENRRLIYYKIDPSGRILSGQIMNVSSRNLHVDRAVDPPLIMMMPYEPEILIKTDSRGRIYSIDTDHFLISVLDHAGQELESRYYPILKHDLIRSELVDQYTDTFQRRAIRRADLPEKWPALAHVLLDDQDRMWAATILPDPDIYRWYILSPSGEPLAAFGLSRDKQIEAVVGETVYIKSFNPGQYSDQVKRYTLNF